MKKNIEKLVMNVVPQKDCDNCQCDHKEMCEIVMKMTAQQNYKAFAVDNSIKGKYSNTKLYLK